MELKNKNMKLENYDSPIGEFLLEERVIEILEDVWGMTGINLEQSLLKDLSIDELDKVDACLELDKVFGIEIILGEVETSWIKVKDVVESVKSKVSESLKEKCKRIQSMADYRLAPGYVILHLDGRSFSSFVKKLKFEKPFDTNFINMMNETSKYLCESIANCKFAYVQSDEITLILNDNSGTSDTWFGNRISKLCSISASMASTKFYQELLKYIITENHTNSLTSGSSYEVSDFYKDLVNTKIPNFDCKAWNVSSWNDAYAWISFRSIDCVRNSVFMFAQSIYPHKKLLGLDTDKVKELLDKDGHSWEEFPDSIKFGRFIYTYEVTITSENGTAIRNKWKVFPGFHLVGPEGKEKFENLNIKGLIQ